MNEKWKSTEHLNSFRYSRLGKKDSLETRRKKSAATSNSKNAQWKGDKVGYSTLHDWVRRHKPIPSLCEDCSKPKKLEAANISGKYKRDLSDWKWLCRRCHMTLDGRLNSFLSMAKKPKSKEQIKKMVKSFGDRTGSKNPNWRGGK